MKNILENAEFITSSTPSADSSPVFRREFAEKSAVKSAQLTVTARGIYEARINGRRVGDFVFAPGWTAYQKRLQVQTYDVTDLLTGGENTVDIYLGRGWYAGNIQCNAFNHSQEGTYDSLGPIAVIASLLISYNDGSDEEITTDSSWKWCDSPIQYSDIYNGETYDARVKLSGWKDAVITGGDRSTLTEQDGEIVCEHTPISAKELIITPKGERVIDFGQEITGYASFRTVGAAGEIIFIDHCEMLDREGNFYNENYRKARSEVRYISDGNGDNFYHPIFSFQGFRYIRLKEYPKDDIELSDFCAIPVYSALKRTGYFSCSDPLVNKLYENVIWSNMDNFLDIPTDCPQRDERLGWTGDAQIFCRTAAYNFDVKRFFEKWLRDMRAEQRDNGAIPEIVPCILKMGNVHGNLAWGDAATVCPWEIYRAYGDIELLREHFPMMKAWVDCIRSKGNTPEEWASGDQFGDWLGLDGVEGSSYGATDNALLATVYAVYSTDNLIKAGKALGYDVGEYEEFKAEAEAAFRECFVGDDGMLTCDTQTAYVCALKFGLSPDPKRYASYLVSMIRENGDHLKTGFIGTPYIMDALSENGYADVAYTLLLQKDYPSWLYCVLKGATTIWEHWDGLKPDGTMWSAAMNSFNHYAYGAVAAWLYGTVAGIRPDESAVGYERIIMAPIPDSRLDFAKASLETRFGTVASEWRKSEDGYILEVDIPAGTTAEITFGKTKATVEEGHYIFEY